MAVVMSFIGSVIGPEGFDFSRFDITQVVKRLIITLPIWLLAGYFWGLWTWKIISKKITKEISKEEKENGSVSD